jgi:hypothetical protein
LELDHQNNPTKAMLILFYEKKNKKTKMKIKSQKNNVFKP